MLCASFSIDVKDDNTCCVCLGVNVRSDNTCCVLLSALMLKLTMHVLGLSQC